MKTSSEAYKRYYEKNKEDIRLYQAIYYLENKNRISRNSKIRRLLKQVETKKLIKEKLN